MTDKALMTMSTSHAPMAHSRSTEYTALHNKRLKAFCRTHIAFSTRLKGHRVALREYYDTVALGPCCKNRAVSLRKVKGDRCPVVAAAGAGAPTLMINAATSSNAFSTVLAVIVGWIVIAGSTIRSVPQILRIVRNKSVDGLSLTSFVSELTAYIITSAYNVAFAYPFSTWGDTFMSAIQHAGIIILIFHHDRTISTRAKLLVVSFLVVVTAILFSGLCSTATYQWLQGFSVALLALGGRLPQIVLNMRRGNSGELSIISTALSVAGNLARVFTTIALVGDRIILFTALSQLLLNGTLLFQTLDTAKQSQRQAFATVTS